MKHQQRPNDAGNLSGKWHYVVRGCNLGGQPNVRLRRWQPTRALEEAAGGVLMAMSRTDQFNFGELLCRRLTSAMLAQGIKYGWVALFAFGD